MSSSLQVLFTTKNTNFNTQNNLKSVISEDNLMNNYKKIFFNADEKVYDYLRIIYIIKEIAKLTADNVDNKKSIVEIMTEKLEFNKDVNVAIPNNFNTVQHADLTHNGDESTNKAEDTAKLAILKIMTVKLGFKEDDNVAADNNFNTVKADLTHDGTEGNNTAEGTAKLAIKKIMIEKLKFKEDVNVAADNNFNTVKADLARDGIEGNNTAEGTAKLAILKIVKKYILKTDYNYDKIKDIAINTSHDPKYFNPYEIIYNYMKFMENSTNTLTDIIYNVAYNVSTIEVFFKVYFLLNNIEILFLCNTFDYKLMVRILNRNNFITDENYRKACFIAMIVFELWSLVNNTEDVVLKESINNNSFYHNFYDRVFINDTENFKRCQKIHNLMHEIKNDAQLFASNNSLIDYALTKNTFEIEIPKRNLDNVIKPLNEIPEQPKNIEFNLNLTPINEKYHYSSSILPNSINGGVRRIKGGDEAKLKELKESYDDGKLFNEDGNKQIDQTRFLFDCLITANEKGASKCLTTLSISTAKVESYKIVETLPRATLVKLATVLGIQFPNGKIETYPEWIKRIKNETVFTENKKDLLDENGEVKLIGKYYKDDKIDPNATDEKHDGADKFDVKPDGKDIYRKLLIIHYIGQVIIDKLGGKNVEYDLLRAQNKAKVQFTKITGPEVSYRTKSNYTNFKSNSRSISLSSNPIFMNMNLYSQQSPEQLERIRGGLISGGAPDAQLYSSNIYEKAITQALNKYRSMGFKIAPNDMNIINDTIEKLKDVEVRILDTYSNLMNVLQFSTMRNNPSFMANLSKEERNEVEEAWKSKDSKKIIDLKNKLEKELKEKQVLADNAHTILDVIFPWKKSLDKIAENTKDISEIKESIKNIPTSNAPKQLTPKEITDIAAALNNDVNITGSIQELIAATKDKTTLINILKAIPQDTFTVEQAAALITAIGDDFAFDHTQAKH